MYCYYVIFVFKIKKIQVFRLIYYHNIYCYNYISRYIRSDYVNPLSRKHHKKFSKRKSTGDTLPPFLRLRRGYSCETLETWLTWWEVRIQEHSGYVHFPIWDLPHIPPCDWLYMASEEQRSNVKWSARMGQSVACQIHDSSTQG